MSAELGKMEKPSVDEFKTGRKLYLVPLIYGSNQLPADYLEIFDKYWKQVEDQIHNLELKLGQVSKIYHELITSTDEDGINTFKELNSLLKFCGGYVDPDFLQAIIKFCSFENMKKYEQEGMFKQWASLRRSSNPHKNAMKVRKGRVGGYIDHMSPDSIQFVNQKVKKELNPFYGYS